MHLSLSPRLITQLTCGRGDQALSSATRLPWLEHPLNDLSTLTPVPSQNRNIAVTALPGEANARAVLARDRPLQPVWGLPFPAHCSGALCSVCTCPRSLPGGSAVALGMCRSGGTPRPPHLGPLSLLTYAMTSLCNCILYVMCAQWRLALDVNRATQDSVWALTGSSCLQHFLCRVLPSVGDIWERPWGFWAV